MIISFSLNQLPDISARREIYQGWREFALLPCVSRGNFTDFLVSKECERVHRQGRLIDRFPIRQIFRYFQRANRNERSSTFLNYTRKRDISKLHTREKRGKESN